MNYLEEYKKCAEKCLDTDYSSKKSIQAHNAAVNRMYEIVELASKTGGDAITKLSELLDDKTSSIWIAHHLVEKAHIDSHTRKRCFKIIEELAKGDSADALGEQIWLKEWGK